MHGYDVGYTYYPEEPAIPKVNATMAKFFQATIVNFVRYVDPTPDENGLVWDLYKSDARRVMNFGTPIQLSIPEFQNYKFQMGDDKMDLEKCKHWQSAPYYPKPDETMEAVTQKEKVLDDELK